MRTRVMAGTVLYLVAIVAPVAWLYVMYGASAPVDANNPERLDRAGRHDGGGVRAGPLRVEGQPSEALVTA